MTHKKYQITRWIVMLVVMAGIVADKVLGGGSAGGQASGGFSPVLIVAIVAGLAVFFLLGRVICGFVCPVGLFQDVLWKITKKLHLHKLSRKERFMRVVNVLNRIILVFFILGIVFDIITSVFFPNMSGGFSIPIAIYIVIGVVMLVANAMARRFFCNVCPIGSFIGLFERLNIIKLKKDCSACTLCGACYDACPMRIKSIYTEIEKSNISTSQCMYCGECIKKCPEDNALSITVCGKAIYKSSQEDFMNNQFSDVNFSKKEK